MNQLSIPRAWSAVYILSKLIKMSVWQHELNVQAFFNASLWNSIAHDNTIKRCACNLVIASINDDHYSIIYYIWHFEFFSTHWFFFTPLLFNRHFTLLNVMYFSLYACLRFLVPLLHICLYTDAHSFLFPQKMYSHEILYTNF